MAHLFSIIPFCCRFHSIPGSKSDCAWCNSFMYACIEEKVKRQERNNIVLAFCHMHLFTYWSILRKGFAFLLFITVNPSLAICHHIKKHRCTWLLCLSCRLRKAYRAASTVQDFCFPSAVPLSINLGDLFTGVTGPRLIGIKIHGSFCYTIGFSRKKNKAASCNWLDVLISAVSAVPWTTPQLLSHS